MSENNTIIMNISKAIISPDMYRILAFAVFSDKADVHRDELVIRVESPLLKHSLAYSAKLSSLAFEERERYLMIKSRRLCDYVRLCRWALSERSDHDVEALTKIIGVTEGPFSSQYIRAFIRGALEALHIILSDGIVVRGEGQKIALLYRLLCEDGLRPVRVKDDVLMFAGKEQVIEILSRYSPVTLYERLISTSRLASQPFSNIFQAKYWLLGFTLARGIYRYDPRRNVRELRYYVCNDDLHAKLRDALQLLGFRAYVEMKVLVRTKDFISLVERLRKIIEKEDVESLLREVPTQSLPHFMEGVVDAIVNYSSLRKNIYLLKVLRRAVRTALNIDELDTCTLLGAIASLRSGEGHEVS